MAHILATTHELPTSFQQSCLRSSHYPENVIRKGANLTPTVLKAYRARLKLASPDLFVQSEAEVDISFRDLGNISGEGEIQSMVLSSFLIVSCRSGKAKHRVVFRIERMACSRSQLQRNAAMFGGS